MLRLRFHGRGGQGAKIASRILGTAAFFEGYCAQDFPLYGAERRGAPISAFTRISKEPILERGIIAEPDSVFVLDETLLDDPHAHPLSGLKEHGIVFVNTARSAVELKDTYKISVQVITLDITKISLKMLGRPILSALAGGIAARIVNLGEDSLQKSIEKELSEIVTEKEFLLKNKEASQYCFHAIKPIEIKIAKGIHKANPVITVPFETALISSPAIYATGNTPLRKTGNWRVFKPVWNYDICTKCMVCVVRCPDACISVNEDGYPYTDYDNCKGCMICVEECPVKAIEGVREAHAW
ncbi:MAG: 2-oxoacid:acceptor oxidoreductase family protein [Candidatus Jettenia sp. CY-1]|nr:MAG: 2-oxoacid:acceptor oxidoreductase family protein [Candidatus Jettenia sp. CY-1]